MKRLIDDADLRSHKLLAILDVLQEADGGALTVGQIQYRLGCSQGVNMSRDEIEAHLRWGANQPNATDAIVQPVNVSRLTQKPGTWSVTPKHLLTATGLHTRSIERALLERWQPDE